MILELDNGARHFHSLGVSRIKDADVRTYICIGRPSWTPLDGEVGHNELRRARKMTTSKKVASDAGKVLSNPKSTKKEKEIAASALADAARRKKRGK